MRPDTPLPLDKALIGEAKTLTKAKLLSQDLSRLALQLGADGRMPSVRDLCVQYNTSRNTVCEALDLLEAQEIVYRRQGSGVYVLPKMFRKSVAILLDSRLFCGGHRSPYWGIFWRHCIEIAQNQTAATDCDYSLYLVDTEKAASLETAAAYLPSDICRRAEAKRLNGVIAIGVNTFCYYWLQQGKVPVVAYAGPGDWMVGHDPYLAVTGLECLIDQGCQRIGVWVDNIIDPDVLTTIRNVFYARQRLYNPDLQWVTASSNQEDPQSFGYTLTRRVFSKPETERPDGLVIGDDMITDGVIAALEQMGIRVGREVQIATSTNAESPMLFRRGDSLICLEYNPREIIHHLFDMVKAILVGKPPDLRLQTLKPVVRVTDNRLD